MNEQSLRRAAIQQSTGDLSSAIVIATIAHQGQKDKAGKDYILHPLHVMNQLETDEERIVAVLHDVIEDSCWTIADLKEAKFSETVCNAVQAITKISGESYLQYLERVAENAIACAVKIEDLRHNSDLSRIPSATQKDFDRAEKYRSARSFLYAKLEPLPPELKALEEAAKKFLKEEK